MLKNSLFWFPFRILCSKEDLKMNIENGQCNFWNTRLPSDKHNWLYFQEPSIKSPSNNNTLCKDTVGNSKGIVSSWKTLSIIALCDASIQLPEIWQGRPSHPHQEILVDEAIVSRVIGVQLVGRSGPENGFHSIWKTRFYETLTMSLKIWFQIQQQLLTLKLL